jgi:hypothetical protein
LQNILFINNSKHVKHIKISKKINIALPKNVINISCSRKLSKLCNFGGQKLGSFIEIFYKLICAFGSLGF